jgi:hypothetical protein
MTEWSVVWSATIADARATRSAASNVTVGSLWRMLAGVAHVRVQFPPLEPRQPVRFKPRPTRTDRVSASRAEAGSATRR